MPGGKGNIKPEDGKQFGNGIDPIEAGRKGGKAISFKKAYSELLASDANPIIWVDEDRIIERIHKGKKQYGLKLTRIELMLAKMDRLAMKSKDAISLQAIKFLWEQMDGKANQSMNVSNGEKIIIEIDDLRTP